MMDAGIRIRDDVIEAVGPRSSLRLPAGAREVSATETTAIPGFIDIHIHGAGGRDFMEATGDALAAVTRKVAEFGTTSLLATTITAGPDDTSRAAAGISLYITQQHAATESRAEVLGIHLEGPFISKTRRGVHPAEWIQSPSEALLQRFLEAAEGKARLITIAPEVLGATPCIEAARKAGLVVSVGHTDANYEQTRFAIARGARSATHTYNAMRPFTHRDPGVIGAVLTSPEIHAELIADGVHVEEGAMKLLLGAKGHDHLHAAQQVFSIRHTRGRKAVAHQNDPLVPFSPQQQLQRALFDVPAVGNQLGMDFGGSEDRPDDTGSRCVKGRMAL